ncbi:hypothetical protein AU193_20730 [Mycobacterium sp. GA-1285]|uniref:hypothetical protein n=1 Tax=Mycobacterium sp. GA-1285 TaxID=1772282 RepID=UPI00074A6C16|nr:hypothetical protein [Mycobacterium sp. GA-1285]KUI22621.1 hypothetical protein AU193_20730 [Mycobacterium sp. GA-1285]
MARSHLAVLTAVLTTAASIAVAPNASAVCYSADCVPNVARNVVEGTPCKPGKYFNYGLGPDGATFVCNRVGVWTPAGPLIGIHNVAMDCPGQDLSAQGSDGVAFVCTDMGGGHLRWAHRIDTAE